MQSIDRKMIKFRISDNFHTKKNNPGKKYIYIWVFLTILK